MEDTLKRLLAVEIEAEQLVAEAKSERERIINNTLQETQQMEEEFKTKIPNLHTDFLEKSNQRAVQTIAELKKRYEERKENLRKLATDNEQKALDASIQLLMQIGQPQ